MATHQPEHCISYIIQRGYALPLMIQAGKYLGKRLLTSGRNSVEDVSRCSERSIFSMRCVFLNVQAKILKADGTAFTPNDLCGPYKTSIQSTLFHSESSQKNSTKIPPKHLTIWIWQNLGLKQRLKRVKNGFESQMRGGICLLGKGYIKANKPYVEDYDKNKPHNYIVALDANNLFCSLAIFRG
ncbi:hypothetical protein CEXT_534991 [Caerostris extrusa]|uniref:DNA-directed DNA polymerase n=1 Tax=Caerostris extrusa TaxID=172846 RepID=A0AAV4P541_CAEEX|nr:hypothetical protein CEXT_534991 [Caerostris extrusa]